MNAYKLSEDITIELTHGHETTHAQVWEWVQDAGLPDDDDYEPAGLYLVYDRRFSGYTLSEILCKTLIESDNASEWDEAISIVYDKFGIEYETDED